MGDKTGISWTDATAIITVSIAIAAGVLVGWSRAQLAERDRRIAELEARPLQLALELIGRLLASHGDTNCRLSPVAIEHIAVRAVEVGDAPLIALCDEALHDGEASDELVEQALHNPDLAQWLELGRRDGWRRREVKP